MQSINIEKLNNRYFRIKHPRIFLVEIVVPYVSGNEVFVDYSENLQVKELFDDINTESIGNTQKTKFSIETYRPGSGWVSFNIKRRWESENYRQYRFKLKVV